MSIKGGAKVVVSENIMFREVPILSPNGDVFIEYRKISE